MPLLSTLGNIGGNALAPPMQTQIMPQQQPTGGIKPPIGIMPPPGQTPGVMSPGLGGIKQAIGTTTPGIVPGQGQDGGQPFQPGVPNQQLPPQQPQQPQPQFGLGGAENALAGGLNAGLNAFGQGTAGGMNTLLAGFQQGQDLRGQGVNALSGNFNAQASNVDPNTGQPLFGQAAQGVNQFTNAGLQAQQRASALSGGQGQAGFDAARLNNPQLDFLNRRGQEALTNQNAARGSVGSGQFQIELQQLGQAQAQQDLQRQFQNNMALSGQGLQAASQAGGFQAQAGQQQGNLANQNASRQTQVSQGNANNLLSAAQGQANLFGQGANQAGQLAGMGAGFQQQSGLAAGNLLAGTAGQVANNRFQTGRDIAGQVANTASGVSNLQNQGGLNLSNLLGAFGQNTAGQVSNAGQMSAQQQNQLAQLLANLGIGAGTNLATMEGQAAGANAGGIAGAANTARGGFNDVASGLGQLFGG